MAHKQAEHISENIVAENPDTSSGKTAAEGEPAEGEKKKRVSKKERVEKRLAQLQAQIQAENAKLNAINRKERNGQLIAFGIFFEQVTKSEPVEDWAAMLEAMHEKLSGRNLDRCLAGIRRLLDEVNASQKDRDALESLLNADLFDGEDKFGSHEEEISPEPPSQLPEAEAQEKNQGSA